MKKVAQTFMLALTLLLCANAQALAASKTATRKQHTAIYAQYFFNAEATYRKIEINGLKLKITYFKDVGDKCKNWIEQRPCWTPKDLRTREANLSRRELTDFIELINESQFLTLDKVYGGAKEGQRHYTELLRLTLPFPKERGFFGH